MTPRPLPKPASSAKPSDGSRAPKEKAKKAKVLKIKEKQIDKKKRLKKDKLGKKTTEHAKKTLKKDKKKSNEQKPVKKQSEGEKKKVKKTDETKSTMSRKQHKKLVEEMAKKGIKKREQENKKINELKKAQAIKHKYMLLEARKKVIREIGPSLRKFLELMNEHVRLDARNSQSMQDLKLHMNMLLTMRLNNEERRQLMGVISEDMQLIKCYQTLMLDVIYKMAETALPLCKTVRVRYGKPTSTDTAEEQAAKIRKVKEIARKKTALLTKRMQGKTAKRAREAAKAARTAKKETPKKGAEDLPSPAGDNTTPKSRGRGGRQSTARTPASTRSAKAKQQAESGGSPSPEPMDTSPGTSRGSRGGRGARGGGSAKRPTAAAQRKPKRTSGRRSGTRKQSVADVVMEYIPGHGPNEPTYCICQRISFGDMIGCDNEECKIEWFHFECVKLTKKPKGKKWYCPQCRGDRPTVPKKKS
uniref:PHD-type domain-containing protein n=1 Tax=Steinernema glaseri TaxID=37863 RepID=A0A1I7ZCK5_9BILA